MDRGKQAIKRRISLNGDSFLHKAFVIVIIRTAQIVAPDVSGRLIVIITVPIVQDISTVEDETTRLYVLVFTATGREDVIETSRLSRNVHPSDAATHSTKTKT